MASTKKTTAAKKVEAPIDNRETFVSLQKTFADSEMPVEEKLKTLYNLQAADNQNICSVMAYHKSVCLGYAKSMQYLLSEVGVKSTIVEGIAASGEAHAWKNLGVFCSASAESVAWGSFTLARKIMAAMM